MRTRYQPRFSPAWEGDDTYDLYLVRSFQGKVWMTLEAQRWTFCEPVEYASPERARRVSKRAERRWYRHDRRARMRSTREAQR